MNIVRSALARLQALFTWWIADIRRRPSMKGKAASLGLGIFILCCVCSIGLSAVRATGQAVGIVATNTPSPLATATPLPTNTAAPTNTPEPSSTPKATALPEPSTVPPTPTAIPGIGSDVRVGDTRFKLFEVTNLGNRLKTRQGDFVSTAKTFVRLRYEAENVGSEKHGFYDIVVLDERGEKIDPDFFPITEEFQQSCYYAIREPIVPGDVRRCERVYTIDPSDRAKIQVKGSSGLSSSEEAFIDIGPLPASESATESTAQPIRQPIAQPTIEPTPAPAPIPEPSPEPPPPASLGVAPQGSDCPVDHPIKGNIRQRDPDKGAKIYHVPGDNGYAQTKPEQCFATIADAQAAGYRAVR
jgi:hypothetical protein